MYTASGTSIIIKDILGPAIFVLDIKLLKGGVLFSEVEKLYGESIGNFGARKLVLYTEILYNLCCLIRCVLIISEVPLDDLIILTLVQACLVSSLECI